MAHCMPLTDLATTSFKPCNLLPGAILRPTLEGGSSRAAPARCFHPSRLFVVVDEGRAQAPVHAIDVRQKPRHAQQALFSFGLRDLQQTRRLASIQLSDLIISFRPGSWTGCRSARSLEVCVRLNLKCAAHTCTRPSNSAGAVHWSTSRAMKRQRRNLAAVVLALAAAVLAVAASARAR